MSRAFVSFQCLKFKEELEKHMELLSQQELLWFTGFISRDRMPVWSMKQSVSGFFRSPGVAGLKSDRLFRLSGLFEKLFNLHSKAANILMMTSPYRPEDDKVEESQTR